MSSPQGDGVSQMSLQDLLFTPLNLNNAIRSESVHIQFKNNSQLDSDIRNVRPGTGSVTLSNGEFTVATDADGADRQGFETGQIAEYEAGVPCAVGMYIEKDSDPVGFVEAGYGGDAFTDELRWHWASDGTPRFDRVRGGTRASIPQSQWDTDTFQEDVTDTNGDVVGEVIGLDPLDGTGESGIDASPPMVGTVGVDMVLYGGGGIAPWFTDLTDQGALEKTYAFVFKPRNESILQQLNQPVFARVDNDGTATADQVVIKERQFTVYGEETSPERGTQHVVDKSETIAAPTALTAIRREAAGGPTRLDVLDLQIRVDNRAHLWFLVDPDVTTAGAWGPPVQDTAGNTVPANETAIQVNDGIAVDASTGVAIEGSQVPGGTGSNVSVGSSSFENTPFVRDRPVVVMLEPFGGNDLGSEEAVINIREGA